MNSQEFEMLLHQLHGMRNTKDEILINGMPIAHVEVEIEKGKQTINVITDGLPNKDSTILDNCKNLIKNNQKVMAVRHYRDTTGHTFSESKNTIDALAGSIETEAEKDKK